MKKQKTIEISICDECGIELNKLNQFHNEYVVEGLKGKDFCNDCAKYYEEKEYWQKRKAKHLSEV